MNRNNNVDLLMSIGGVANPRLYYMGNEYMAESVSLEDQKYSMRFENASQSRDPYEQSKKQPVQAEQSSAIKQQYGENQPKKLGPTVFNRIKVLGNSMQERYKEQNKLDTDDPDILYSFYMMHRKQKTAGDKVDKNQKLKTAMESSQKVDPALQRKILSKIDFDRYLEYDPRDIYYTLVVEKKKLDEDRKVQQRVNQLNKRPEEKKQKKITNQMIDRLANPEKYNKKSKDQLNHSFDASHKSLSPEREKRKSLSPQSKAKSDPQIAFGHNLVNLYRDRSNTGNVITVDGLYSFWMALPDKQQQNVKLANSDVKKAIQKYMVHQVNNLRMAHESNKGFDTAQDSTLFKFLNTSQKKILDKFHVAIPQEGFKAYLEEYNKHVIEQKKKKEETLKKQQQKQKQEQNKMMRTAMNRPASATPLSILAQPKNSQTMEALQLIKLYPNDKTLKEFLKTRIHPMARRPEEYGVYQPQEEIKRKQWVKSEKGINPDKQIEQMVMNTTIKGFDAGSATAFTSVGVMKILEEEYLEDNEKWGNMHNDLRRELKILAFKLPWCRDALLSFSEQQMSKKSSDLQYIDNNVLIDEIVDYLTKLNESSRKAKLAYLGHDLKMLQAKSKFETQNKNIEENPEQEAKSKRKFYWFLQTKAKQYVRMYISDNQHPAQSRTAAVITIYEAAKSQHPIYLEKHFPVVESQADHACPPNFKHEFFRIVKEINPYTMQKQRKPKSHIWAPTGTSSDSINQQTFNHVVKAYSKNKYILKEQPAQKQLDSFPKKGTKSQAKTVWTKDKADERLKFMMTYDEAKECTFKPIVHKAIM